jgi:Fe-S cluster biogenesis protein NfuA
MLKTGNTIVSIYTEMTPNPETMKFVANKLLYPGKSIDFPDESTAAPSPLAKELFAFPFIRSVFIASNFVTLSKTIDTTWDDVIPTIRQFLKEYLEEGKAVINEDQVVVKKDTNTVNADDEDVVVRIKELLENYVKPAVEMDGGAISFKGFDNNEQWKLLLMTGFCGGFTTFSAFTLDGIGLLREERYAVFFGYLAASVAIGLLATFAGMKLVR